MIVTSTLLMHGLCQDQLTFQLNCFATHLIKSNPFLKVSINFCSQPLRRSLQLWHRQEMCVHRGTSFRGQANLASAVPVRFHSHPDFLEIPILHPRRRDRELSLSHHSEGSSLCPHVQPLLTPQSEPSRTGHNSSLYHFECWYSCLLTMPFWAICKPWLKCLQTADTSSATFDGLRGLLFQSSA
jgi:hypothetical protein